MSQTAAIQPAMPPVMPPPVPPASAQTGGVLQHNGIFRVFDRENDAPVPIPSKSQFYRDNLGAQELWGSYERGLERFVKDIYRKPLSLLSCVGFGTALGLLLTAFHGHKKHAIIEKGFYLALVGYPVMAALRNLPKIEKSYELIKQGELTQGRETFKSALDDLVYQVCHVYLKPILLGGMILAPLLSLPRILRGNPKGIDKLLKWVLNAVGITEKTGVIQRIARFSEPIASWGDRLVKRFEAVPLLRRLLHD